MEFDEEQGKDIMVAQYEEAESGTALNLNKWYHIAFTYRDGDGLRLYVNGEQVGYANQTGFIQRSTQPVYIGWFDYFRGMLDEVQIYSRHLSAEQILQDYQQSREGLSDNSTIVAAETRNGEQWRCQVIPSDGLADGTAMTSNTITVGSIPPVQYKLTIKASGSGTTDPTPGTSSYPENTQVSVDALPDTGYKLEYWLLNNIKVGSADPYTVTMSGNQNLTAVFVEGTPAPASIFEDSYESGSFSAWSGTSITSGETATIVTSPAYSGTYAAMFRSNGGGSYERAGTYRRITAMPELYARGYVYVSQSGIADNSDSIFFLVLRDSSNNLAYAGWKRNTSGTTRWALTIRSGTGYVTAYSTTTPSLDTWYSVELHWKRDPAAGLGELWVNGVRVIQILNRNTAQYGSATTLRFGIAEAYNVAGTTLYGDSFKIAASYIGPDSAPPTQHELVIDTVGTGTTNPGPGTYIHNEGITVSVDALPSVGWTLSHWLLDSVNIGSTDPYMVTMDTDHSLTAIFIEAQGEHSLNVNIVGSGTVSKTPNQATYAGGTVVTLIANPAAGWSFSEWSGDLTGSANPTTITMNADKTVTATFTQTPSSLIFQDGYESGSFSAWSGTGYSAGETRSVVSTIPYDGTYAARFTSDGSGTYERAYSYRTITAANELRTGGYIYVSGSGITVNSARIYFMVLRDGSGNNIGYAGWGRYTDGKTYWYVMIRSGTGYVSARSTATPSVNTWYNVEFHWKRDATAGLGELRVNGELVCQVNGVNTSQYGGVTTVRFGIAETGSIAVASAVYVDEARIETIA
jgi:hypothetical protein